ncbi:MAG: zf-HC2 domain-containing protein [Lachnospiraceae bacterium]|nr:zf-HC2 domain-containing protein [Lachnospiraceae bacterium]
MNNTYSDAIVIDLLPSYIDGLLSEETGLMVTEHLKNSPKCMEIYNMMIADLDISSKRPVKRFKYRKKHVGMMILLSYILFLLLVWIYMIIEIAKGL